MELTNCLARPLAPWAPRLSAKSAAQTDCHISPLLVAPFRVTQAARRSLGPSLPLAAWRAPASLPEAPFFAARATLALVCGRVHSVWPVGQLGAQVANWPSGAATKREEREKRGEKTTQPDSQMIN